MSSQMVAEEAEHFKITIVSWGSAVSEITNLVAITNDY